MPGACAAAVSLWSTKSIPNVVVADVRIPLRTAQIGVHILYKRAEIPANAALPAVSVTYTKQEKAANPGSTPVSATNLIKINYLHCVCQGWNPNRIVRVSPLPATDGTGA